ncbi:hypothetical protein [Novosphingobium sp.]|uniref:hypothetical protein n=1 Tax=Novosphingobium sp. TaxID=1874826 RepID=UPI001DC8C934|nr:hypothetical protein [Novosphingobium sp.]MBX9661835.1 hypothetical protein [Novosphingobium sp.]
MGIQNHAFRFVTGVLVVSLAGCATTYAYSIETREQVVVAGNPTCIEQAVSKGYALIEARADTTANGMVQRLFFDLAKGGFGLKPEMRNYSLDWRRVDTRKIAITLGWGKRGDPITSQERRQVDQALNQVYARLSHDCGFAVAKLETVES